MELQINTADSMEALGGQFARAICNNCVIYLRGPLGAGKTTWVHGFIRALGYTGTIKSPTYGLVETYRLGGHEIHHFDLYRLHSPEELENIGIRDYWSEHSIYIVEWPERGRDVLLPADIEFNILYDGSARKVEINAYTAAGRNLLASLK